MKKVLCLLLAVSLLGFIGAFDSARAELLIREGFDNFDSGVRPFGWTFNNCNGNADTYTTATDYGVSSPSLKMDADDDRATSRTFETSADSKLLFWIKGQGSIGTASLLVEEYYGSWGTVVDVTTLPASGTTQGPHNLSSGTSKVRFTFTKDTADGVALDDVRVQSGIYLRAWHMAWNFPWQTGCCGDATYYEFPGPDEVLGTLDDKNLLIDGGGQATHGATVANLLDVRLSGDPFNNTIYFMALSSPGWDHYNGLKMAVSRYNVLNYYENVRWAAGDKPGYDSLITDINSEGSNVYYYNAGDWLSGPDTTVGPSWGTWSGWDPNITARVLVAKSGPPPGDDNEWAGMLLIKCGDTGFLTGGDHTAFQQETWIQDPENTDHSYDGAWNDLTHADFYKVGQHGSSGASSPSFMNRMQPSYAIVEVAHGSGNLPTKEALDACYDAGAIQYRTDLDHIVLAMVDDSDNYEVTRWQAWSVLIGGDSSSDFNTAPPDLVTGLTVDEADDIKVVISWSDGGYDYDVYRSKFSGGDDSAGARIQPGTAFATGIYEKLTASPIGYTTYTDTSWPITDIAYYYMVASIASTNTGAYYTKQERRWSNEVSAYIPYDTPTPVGYKTPTPTPTPVPTAPITGVVLITEVHQNSGASPIGTHEWVEIQNLNGSVINLQNWRIGTVGGVDVFVSNPATLLDGECAIIHFTTTGPPAGDDDSTGRSNTGYGAVFDFYVAKSDVLDNSQDQVVLKNSGSAYVDVIVYWDNEATWYSADPQVVVDGGEWNGDPVDLGSGSSIRMMKRIDPDDNNDKTDWLAFTALGGEGATPGMDNTGYLPPIMLISEADPRGLNATIGHPWFELQNVSGSSLSINLNGWVTDSLDDDNFTISSNAVTLTDGRMALVHYADGLSENDSTGWSSSTSPGARLNCWDLYLGDAADGNLYTPQDEIVLYNFIGPDYGVSGPEDAVVYWDGNFGASGADAGTLGGWSQWTVGTDTANMVDYGVATDTNGFQRQTYADTNTKADWTAMTADSLNPGLQNMGYFQPSPTPVGYKTPIPTPSPGGGGGRKWATPFTMSTEPPPTTPITAPEPTAAPTEELLLADPGDYDGDGTVDVAVFRPASGLWSIQDYTRLYFGLPHVGVRLLSPPAYPSGSDPYTGDLPASGDYDGDGTADIAIFRPTSSLWSVRNVTRTYLGIAGDSLIPADYNGDGICDIAVFRAATGLWAVKGLTKLYFGIQSDQAVPGDYDGDGAADIGIFRSSAGLWKIKDITLFYLGAEGDIAVPGDYDGSGLWTAGVFRPASGLWAIRGITRLYFGAEGDQLLPGDYDGDLADDIAIFRSKTGLWTIRDLTRLYLGK